MLRSMFVIACLLLPSAAFAKAAGVDSRDKFPDLPAGSVGCGSSATGMDAGCHFTDADPELMVTIDGPSQIVEVGPNGFGSYTASIPVDFMNRLGSGINVALDAPNQPGCILEPVAPIGKLGLRNDTPGVADDILSHIGTDLAANLNGVWSYQFRVRDCQAPGMVSLRVAMNAFNGDGSEEFELWNSAKLDLTVPEPGGAALVAAAGAALAVIARARARS